MDNRYRMIPAGSGAFLFMWLVIAFIAGIYVVIFFAAQSDERGWEWLALVAVIDLAIIGLFVSFIYQARHIRYVISDVSLRIGPGLYSRTILKEDIVSTGVKVVDLHMEKQYSPSWRTNGLGLPGFLLGWYRLKNKEKALLYLTDQSRVVYIPTSKKYSVVLSVLEAEEFAGKLQNWR